MGKGRVQEDAASSAELRFLVLLQEFILYTLLQLYLIYFTMNLQGVKRIVCMEKIEAVFLR